MSSLKINNHIYDILVEQNPAGLFYLKNDIIKYANEQFAKTLKAPLENIQGQSIYNFVAKESTKFLSGVLKKLKLGESVRATNIFIQRKNTTTYSATTYFSLHLNVVSNINNILEIAGASRDATNRIEKFNELKENKSKYEILFKNSIQGIFIYNYHKEKIIEANETALKEFGYEDDIESFLQLSRFDFIPKKSSFFPEMDNHTATYEHGQKVMREEEPFYTPGIFRKKNGDTFLVEGNVVPTLQNYGEAYIIFRNVTEKILNQKALKKSEHKYRNIFENSHEGILYFNLKDRKIEMCNQNALEILGIDSIETFKTLSAKNFYYDKKIKNIDYTKFTLHLFKKALRTRRTEATFKLRQQTGNVIWVSAVLIYERSNSKKPYIIIFIRNINDLVYAQNQLDKKNKELQKYIDSNMQLENFAYLASHDLQTPLRSIGSFTQLLQASLQNKLNSEEAEYIKYIVTATKSMKNLVDDLLAYSIVNETKINVKEFQVFELLNQLLIELKQPIKQSNTTVNLLGVNQSIKADLIKIKRVFQNLITNAIKFTKKDESPIIEITGSETKTEWVFSVKDNGIGIDEAYKERIFLLFKKLHTNEYEGTGIGLAIVKKIIDQHNGKIWFQSTPNKGSTFSFSLPIKL